MAAGDKTTHSGNLLAFKTASVTGETQDKVLAVSLVGSTGSSLNPTVSSSTGTTTTVANAVTTGTLLAANTSRKGATIFNDDTPTTGASLYVKLGATASTSSFTVKIAPGGYYEVPFGYTGIIDAIASAATGNARITELT